MLILWLWRRSINDEISRAAAVDCDGSDDDSADIADRKPNPILLPRRGTLHASRSRLLAALIGEVVMPSCFVWVKEFIY